MGLTISNVFNRLFGKTQKRILMGMYYNINEWLPSNSITIDLAVHKKRYIFINQHSNSIFGTTPKLLPLCFGGFIFPFLSFLQYCKASLKSFIVIIEGFIIYFQKFSHVIVFTKINRLSMKVVTCAFTLTKAFNFEVVQLHTKKKRRRQLFKKPFPLTF